MKNIFNLTLISATLIALTGSGCDSVQNAAQNAEAGISAADLQHSWTQNQCSSIGSLKLIGASMQTDYAFSGAQITKTDQIFSSANCTDPAISVAYTGTFNKGNQVTDGVFQLDVVYTNVTVTAQNDAGVKVLTDTKFCGSNTWVVNQGVNLTSQARDALCPLTAMPDNMFDIYTTANSTLILGESGDNATADQRPTSLDNSVTFHQN